VTAPCAISCTGRLRNLLEEIVSDLEKNPVETHAERLRQIAKISPHAIEVLPSKEPLERYNCIMHSLAIVGKLDDYPHLLLLARTAFLRYLIDEGVLKSCDPGRGLEPCQCTQ